jgi:peptidoglycan/LPS O-acetylase OafA/YrhL
VPIGAEGDTQRRRDIPALTGLRGVAALWVVAYHLLLPAALIGGLPARMVGRGYLAVDVFFVLSGYVMALSYGAWFAGPWRWRVFAAFLWRRAARLYPIYGAILVFRLAYTAWRYRTFHLPRPWIAAPMAHPWSEAAANLLLVQSWGVAPSTIGPAWSVSTEWGAYWAFPALAVLMLQGRPRMALGGALAAAGLLLATASLLHASGVGWSLDAWDGRTATPLMRCLAGFCLGLGVRRLSTCAGAARLAARASVGFAVLLLLAALLVSRAPDLAIYPLFPLLVLCLACGHALPARLFAAGPVVWLGEISYSLYLLHIFLLHPIDMLRATLRLVAAPGWADLATVLAVLAFLLAAASVSYRCIERPCRRMLAGMIRY